jgi:hypothetical protein
VTKFTHQPVELIALDDAEIKYSTVRTGTQETRVKVEFSILLLREESARKTLKFLGHR